MTKKLVKKAQLDTGSEEGRGWGGLFRTKQNISQSVKRDFFLKKKKKATLRSCLSTQLQRISD